MQMFPRPKKTQAKDSVYICCPLKFLDILTALLYHAKLLNKEGEALTGWFSSLKTRQQQLNF